MLLHSNSLEVPDRNEFEVADCTTADYYNVLPELEIIHVIRSWDPSVEKYWKKRVLANFLFVELVDCSAQMSITVGFPAMLILEAYSQGSQWRNYSIVQKDMAVWAMRH